MVTNVGGVLESDTTWTMSRNPYNVTKSVVVPAGVTLTIEQGALVYLQRHTLQVDGTLRVLGTSRFPITFSEKGGFGEENDYAGVIIFGESSNSWNEQTSGGSKIEYTQGFDLEIKIKGVSPKITLTYGYINITIIGGSPEISYSLINGYPLSVYGGSPKIYRNTFEGALEGKFAMGLFSSSAWVHDNHIGQGGFETAIIVDSGAPVIERNIIQNSQGNGTGLEIYGSARPTIENNTIQNSIVGLKIYNEKSNQPSPTIRGNNIYQNSKYNIYLGKQGGLNQTAPNINAAQNWWGTNNTQTINQSIYDHKNDPNLGTVSFTPFLTESNPYAVPNQSQPNINATPSSTPSPASTLTPSPSIPEFPSWQVLPVLIATSTFLLLKNKYKKPKTTSKHTKT